MKVKSELYNYGVTIVSWLKDQFFHFVGLSGWLIIALIIQINKLTYIATPETLSSLHWTEGTLIFTWLLAKHEHIIFEFIAKFVKKDDGGV